MAITISGNGIVEANLADNAVTLAKMASGTDGEILTYDASGNPVAVSVGTDGQVLTSTGAGSPPAFETAAGGGKVLQVVSAAINSTDSTSTSTSWVDSGLTINITPNASGNKIYVWSSGGIRIVAGSGHTRIDYRLIESATSSTLASKHYIGATGTAFTFNGAIDCSGLYTTTGTSEITFKTQARKAGTTPGEANNFAALGNAPTRNTLIAMEVEA